MPTEKQDVTARERRITCRRVARGGLSVRAALRGYGNPTMQPQIKLDGPNKKTQLHRMANRV